MANDDMHVIMYKILSYLYSCMKKGEDADESKLRWDSPLVGCVPQRYWERIMEQLASKGLVGGVSVRSFDGEPQVLMDKPYVTMDGVEFLMENSMMSKAKQFLQDVKASVPFI